MIRTYGRRPRDVSNASGGRPSIIYVPRLQLWPFDVPIARMAYLTTFRNVSRRSPEDLIAITKSIWRRGAPEGCVFVAALVKFQNRTWFPVFEFYYGFCDVSHAQVHIGHSPFRDRTCRPERNRAVAVAALCSGHPKGHHRQLCYQRSITSQTWCAKGGSAEQFPAVARMVPTSGGRCARNRNTISVHG